MIYGAWQAEKSNHWSASKTEDQYCYRAVFEFVVGHKIPYTINSNGVFFNMTPLPKDTLDRISDIIAKFESSELFEAKSTPPTSQ